MLRGKYSAGNERATAHTNTQAGAATRAANIANIQ